MRLPEDDEAYLASKGFAWELIPDGDGACLVIKNYWVKADKFDRDSTDLMIRIPPQYNIAKLDMYYVDPPLKLRNGQYPNAADRFETHVGRQWQRFSRHLQSWRAGVDGLPMFLTLVNQELH